MSKLATVLDKAVIRVRNDNFESFERRLPDSGVIDIFKRDTDRIVPKAQMEALKTSFERITEIAVKSVTDVTVLAVRDKDPNRDQLTTTRVTTNWSTLGFAFEWVPSTGVNNYITEEEEIAGNLFNGWRSVFYDPTDSLETRLIAFLEANKWSDVPAVSVPGVQASGDSYTVNVEKFFRQAPAVMRSLRMNNDLYDLSNVGAWDGMRRDMEDGTANSKNRAQFVNEMQKFYSHNLDVSDGSDETHFVMPRNTLGLLNIIEDDAAKSRMGHDGDFYTIYDPWFGFRWGVRATRMSADRSGVYGEGYERALGYTFDVFADFSPVRVFSSDPDTSPIVKFEAQPQ